jgi:hypothetical protein
MGLDSVVSHRHPSEPMLAALKRTAAALRDGGIDFALAGSMAAWARGGPAPCHDVDFVLAEADVEAALQAVAAAGLRIERPPEGWLVKAWDGDVLVDLIWDPLGVPITAETLSLTESLNVAGMPLPVMSTTDVLTSKLLALSESHLDFEGLVAIVRALREQIDWGVLRRRTAGHPLPRSFLFLVGELNLLPVGESYEPESLRIALGTVSEPDGAPEEIPVGPA